MGGKALCVVPVVTNRTIEQENTLSRTGKPVRSIIQAYKHLAGAGGGRHSRLVGFAMAGEGEGHEVVQRCSGIRGAVCCGKCLHSSL